MPLPVLSFRGDRKDDPPRNPNVEPSRDNKYLNAFEPRLLSSTYNAPKVLVSIIQAAWGIITIYGAQGDQIQIYGYAAFGSTVVPYAYMSILNGLANLLTPSCPALILIEIPILEEARKVGKGGFSGSLSVNLEDAHPQHGWMNPKFENGHQNPPRWESWSKNLIRFLFLLSLSLPIFMFSLIPVAVVGGLTRFEAGSSAPLQRGFTMSWLAVGILVGILMPDFARMRRRLASVNLDTFLTITIYSPASIGGMVVVGQMLREYGICTLIYQVNDPGSL